MRRPASKSGSHFTVNTSSCWFCPGHTFNAGLVCTDCLNAGHEVVPEDLRRYEKPKALIRQFFLNRRRLTPAEAERFIRRARDDRKQHRVRRAGVRR